MIPSAVVIPEESPIDQTQQNSGSLKRRQSSISESSDSNKRPRLDTRPSSTASRNESTSPTTAAPSASSPTDGQARQGAMSPPELRRRQTSNVEQDKSRNRRLFGGLLSTLSQSAQPVRRASGGTTKRSTNPTAPASSQREEIESRQRERLKRESHDMAESARIKKQQVDRQRRVEQRRWDEQARSIKHENMRATAGYLQTKTEPKLFYKPWELRDFEEDQIKRQIQDVEERMTDEAAGFEARQQNLEEEPQGKSEHVDTPKAREGSSPPQLNGNMETEDDHHEEMDSADKIDVAKEETRNGDTHSHGKTNGDPQTDLELPDAPKEDHHPSERNDTEVKAEEPTRNSKSDEHDTGGEELEQGQEDDVIY